MKREVHLAIAATAGLLWLGAAPKAAAQEGECRDTEFISRDDGSRSTRLMCQGPDGNWGPATIGQDGRPRVAMVGERVSSLEGSQVVPSNFQGRLLYSGTYDGSVTTPPRVRGNRSVESLVGAMGVGARRDYEGSFIVELEINGSVVTGVYRGSGGLSQTRFSGTRSGDRCQLTANGDGVRIEAECTPTRFAGTARSAFGERRPFQVNFNAQRGLPAGTVDAQSRVDQPSFPFARCSSMGLPAPRTQEELNAVSTYDLLVRGQAMYRNWTCSGLYSGTAAARGDVQGMAVYSYTFSTDSPTPNEDRQTYWCQKAYRGARSSRLAYELDAVNHFCPIESIAALMTPAERRANNVSVVRAAQTSATIRQEAEDQARQAFDMAVALSASDGNGGNVAQGEQDLEASRLQRETHDRQFGQPPG